MNLRTRRIALIAGTGVVLLLLLWAAWPTATPVEVEEPISTDLPADTFHVTPFEDEFPLHFEDYLRNTRV